MKAARRPQLEEIALAATKRIATMQAEITDLKRKLADMISIAESDGWDKASTGRQLVLRDAVRALAKEGK